MTELSIKANKKQLNTVGLSQPKTTKSGPKKVGAPLGTVPKNKSPLLEPNIMGKQFGRVKIISPENRWLGKGNRKHVFVECMDCKEKKWIMTCNLYSGKTQGCRRCGNPRQVPKWLYSRMQGAELRCKNPNNKMYKNYGGRGIQFRFKNPLEASIYVKNHLGLDKTKQIDRIDNDGHYEPGNLRLSTNIQNASHTRKTIYAAAFHAFRIAHPEIKYADSTLHRLFSTGLSFDQIIERFYRPSFKPKGKYGTYKTPDHFIASLYQES